MQLNDIEQREQKAQETLNRLNAREKALLKKREQLGNRIQALKDMHSKQLQKKRTHNLILLGAWAAKNLGVDLTQNISIDEIARQFIIKKAVRICKCRSNALRASRSVFSTICIR